MDLKNFDFVSNKNICKLDFLRLFSEEFYFSENKKYFKRSQIPYIVNIIKRKNNSNLNSLNVILFLIVKFEKKK